MRGKMPKEKIWNPRCKHLEPCDCGKTEMCYHPDTTDDECCEESCPKKKGKKR